MKKYVFESLKFFCAAILCTILSAFATPSWGALPTGYTELEYVQTDGNSWIDTNLKGNMSYKYEIDFQQIDSGKYRNWGAFNQETYDTGPNMSFTYADGFAVRWTVTGASTQLINSLSRIDTNRHKIIIDNGNVTWDGISKGRSDGHQNNYQLNYNLFLGTVNPGGTTPTANAKSKYYSYKVWDTEGTLIQNFVPAKNASGVVGMYDTVNDVFYENKGTGEFVAGPETCDGTIVNYVSATGTGVQNGTPTPDNPIYPTFYQQGNMVLRAVGDYKDTFDATTGKITRRVGVKVLDGSEASGAVYFGPTNAHYIGISADVFPGIKMQSADVYATHWLNGQYGALSGAYCSIAGSSYFAWNEASTPNLRTARNVLDWLAAQKAAGTPVTVYYPLAEETTEDWPASYCETPIKIATTKYNESAFSPLNTALANAISVVDTVVSNTITQAGRIATLQAQKQTRPNDIADDNEKCPAGKKCLLVEDASGIPHWYEIVERYSRLPDGYTELEYIESTGTQYIDTGVTGPARWVGAAQSTSVFDKSQCILGADYVNNSAYSASVYLASQIGSNGVVWRLGSASSTVATTDYAEYDVNFAETSFSGTINGESLSASGVSGFTNWYIGMDRGASSIYYFIGKIYTQKAYQNDTLVRDFVPAKDAGGVVGMYDTVSGQFFTNSGDGEFIAGDPVAE